MPEIPSSLKSILDYLMEKRGFDFSGYHPAMLARRIGNRVTALNGKDFKDYLIHVKDNPAEIDRLLDVITINVSRFFRDTLTFELLADRILPALVLEKAAGGTLPSGSGPRDAPWARNPIPWPS
nr:hypothetical protein [Desulfobacula sp.]